MNDKKRYATMTFTALLLAVVPVYAATQPLSHSDAHLADAKVQYTRGGHVQSFRFKQGRGLPVSLNPKQPLAPADAAVKFANDYGHLLGTTSKSGHNFTGATGRALRGASSSKQQFEVARESLSGNGEHRYVLLKQTINGLPVFGGAMVVQFNADMQVSAMHSKLSASDRNEWFISNHLSADEAEQIAIELTQKYHPSNAQIVSASTPALWIFDPSIAGTGAAEQLLAWRVTTHLESNSQDQAVHQLMMIDAVDGTLLWRSSLMQSALNRSVYDNQNDPQLGSFVYSSNLVRSEDDTSNVGNNPAADQAFDYAGDTYNFYHQYHNRDGIDNQGSEIVTIVNVCNTANACRQNALWYLGSADDPTTPDRAVFSDGLVVDDVVAHELTHGVTQYASELEYLFESGSINESFADMWGEWIDQNNDKGNDAPEVRWLLAEDSSLGAVRNMKNPPQFNHPDRVNSEHYSCVAGSIDYGGVHTNNGVGNKAAYLLTDGDTFNGIIVEGIGFEKTAKIFYEVNTQLLTPTSDYTDLAAAMKTACSTLTGQHGITNDDCLQVDNAILAVEMETPVCQKPPVALCQVGETHEELFFEDFSGYWDDRWEEQRSSILSIWEAESGSLKNSRESTLGEYFLRGSTPNSQVDSSVAMIDSVSLPDNAFLHLKHVPNMEVKSDGLGYDAGVIEYSTDEGGNWQDAGSLLIENGYDFVVSSNSNTITGRDAFVTTRSEIIESKLDLSSLSGQRVKFRFRIGSDSSGSERGWDIDDVNIYACKASPLPLRPIADAGDDINSTTFYKLTLSGRDNRLDADQGALSYSWTQTRGPAVSINSADTATPTIELPSTPSELSFTLRITDTNSSLSSTDEVNVFVSPSMSLVFDQTERVTGGTGSIDRYLLSLLMLALHLFRRRSSNQYQ